MAEDAKVFPSSPGGRQRECLYNNVSEITVNHSDHFLIPTEMTEPNTVSWIDLDKTAKPLEITNETCVVEQPNESSSDETDSQLSSDGSTAVCKEELLQPFVNVVETHTEQTEAYDWEGILELRKGLKDLHREDDSNVAIRHVFDFSLYLTGDDKIPLEEPGDHAVTALADAPRYDVCTCEREESEGFVEFVQASHEEDEEEGYAPLHLSPLDVLSNTILTQPFSRRNRFLRLNELVLGGPNLQLSERGIEKLAQSLSNGTPVGLTKLVLSVPAVDLPAMEALGLYFRSRNSKDLTEVSFYARRATETRIGARSMMRRIPTQAVLGRGLSIWVDAWKSKPTIALRTLNLSQMDIGNEGAFALSRLLLIAPHLQVLQLASQKSFLSETQKDLRWKELETAHPSLNFVGSKRFLESLILAEDLHRKANGSTHCARLKELNLSGWELEEDFENDENDDDKAVDDFYDHYSFWDEEESSSTTANYKACSVVAAMLRVNTSLETVVLASEGGSVISCGSTLSVRSTLAIARALRDHRSLGGRSNLRRLILSTQYHKKTKERKNCCSSWAIQERKRAVGKVFYHALKDKGCKLEELSCTMDFKDLEPFGTNDKNNNNNKKDLKSQLESFLEDNKAFHQSLQKIQSFWIPTLSSWTIDLPVEEHDDDDDETDCEFVVTLEDKGIITTLSSLPKIHPPPIKVRLLPSLLAMAGREVAHYDALFECCRALAKQNNDLLLFSKEGWRSHCPKHHRTNHHHR